MDEAINLTIPLTSRELEELIVALALRRLQLGHTGRALDLHEMAKMLDLTGIACFGWDATISLSTVTRRAPRSSCGFEGRIRRSV
jgi:hypothetical protein